jgi:hypothetical protein
MVQRKTRIRAKLNVVESSRGQICKNVLNSVFVNHIETRGLKEDLSCGGEREDSERRPCCTTKRSLDMIDAWNESQRRKLHIEDLNILSSQHLHLLEVSEVKGVYMW